jgi:hypothetical protein
MVYVGRGLEAFLFHSPNAILNGFGPLTQYTVTWILIRTPIDGPRNHYFSNNKVIVNIKIKIEIESRDRDGDREQKR